jgi:Zn-dependent protease
MHMSGFKIGTIRGIPIRIHFTFLLVLPLLAFGFGRTFSGAAAMAGVPPEQLRGNPLLWGLGVALALFASVLVHELAHALYALRKGGQIRDITLLMIGGVTNMSESPREARHEAVMALVGPLVSLTLGALFWTLEWATPGAGFNLRFALFHLGALNIFLGLFNLLPAFPMDGGRILRALLTKRLGLVRATRVASRVGQVLAVLLGVWGLLSVNMFLMLIALFVFVGAKAETQSVMINALLSSLHVRDVMNQHVATMPAGLSVYVAAERMLRERDVALVTTDDDGNPEGVVTLEAVQRVPRERRSEVSAREVAVPLLPLSPDDDAARALRTMSDRDVSELPVAEDSRLVGTVSRDDILRVLKLNELEATQHNQR